MKVSICMITYNHENYISEAIEGVLSQKTTFAYELVIGEDCSLDNTRNIVNSYKERFPDRIRVLLPETNLGMMPNFVATLQACTGEYIALCEGDDYWIDPYKLQKQYDLLETKPGYIACFHPVKYFNQESNTFGAGGRVVSKKKTFTFQDILNSWTINTCSLFFRNVFNQYPDFFYKVPGGDLFLCLLLASKGDFYYLQDKMSVYRVNDQSFTPIYEAYKLKNKEKELLKFEQDLLALDEFTGHEFTKIIRRKIYSEHALFKLERIKNKPLKFFYLVKYILKYTHDDLITTKNVINKFFPSFYMFYPFKKPNL